MTEQQETEVVDTETGEVMTADEAAAKLVDTVESGSRVVSPDLQERLEGVLGDLSDAMTEHEGAKEAAKAAKAALDAAHARLARVAREVSDTLAGRNMPADAPMFDENGDARPEVVATSGTLSPEMSRDSIGVLGFSNSLTDKLIDANIITLGDLQARMTADGEWWWKGINGIAGERAGNIVDAYNAYVYPGALDGEPASDDTPGL